MCCLGRGSVSCFGFRRDFPLISAHRGERFFASVALRRLRNTMLNPCPPDASFRWHDDPPVTPGEPRETRNPAGTTRGPCLLCLDASWSLS